MCGYWTHGGYLNWDTGYGFKRWHAGRTWALAQQGLLAIAAIAALSPAPRAGRVGEAQFDRGLALYERLSQAAADGKGIAPSNLYDVNVAPLGPSIRELFAARMQANAVRAVALGLGGMQAPEPPPLYSFDGDIGRLAVTTKHYSTAVLPVSQRAFPYGGMELCRLYDGDQRVVSNVGGRPWASFGVLVRQRGEGDRDVAASQGGPAAAPAAAAAVLPARPRRPGTAVSAATVRRPVRDADRAGAHRVRRGRASTRPTASPRPGSKRAGRSRAGAAGATRSTCCSPRGAGPRRSRRCCAAGAA